MVEQLPPPDAAHALPRPDGGGGGGGHGGPEDGKGFPRAGHTSIPLDAQGRVAAWRAAAARLLGHAAAEIVGQPFTRLGTPGSEARWAAALASAAGDEGQAVLDEEGWLLRRDGSPLWARVTVVPVHDLGHRRTGYRMMVHDLTPWLGDDSSRSESEARLAGIIAAAMDAIVSVDEAQRIVLFNPAAEQVFRCSAADALGSSLERFIPERFRGAHGQQVQAYGAGGATRRGMGRLGQLCALRADGEEFPMEATISRTTVGGRTLYTVILRDVSALQQAEQALVESEQRYQHAQKLEAVGRLAGGIAHDFNNMLTAIRGFATLLRLDVGEEAEALTSIAEIEKAATRAASLTRQLLAFSRKQVLQPTVLNLNTVVVQMQGMLTRLIGEDVRLETLLDAQLSAVQADPGQIEQVLMNLAVNAKDAMPHGGQLTIKSANVFLDADYARMHDLRLTPGLYAMLAVTDTGHGMDAATRARIFEPFFTTKEQGRGTGLGLSTVYGIVKQSGGYIWVYSEPSVGTTFKIYLPAAERSTAPEPPRATLAERGGSETILLVEDEAMVRTFAAKVLTRAGYAVLHTGDPREGVEIAREHAGPISLLLSDVIMPAMNGRQLAREVAVLRPQTAVLYISGYPDDTIIRHGVLEAGIAFLEKPFTPEALCAKVRATLDARRPA